MASSKNRGGVGAGYTVDGGGRGLNVSEPEREEGGGSGRSRGMRKGGRELVCTCSPRERIRRSIGG